MKELKCLAEFFSDRDFGRLDRLAPPAVEQGLGAAGLDFLLVGRIPKLDELAKRGGRLGPSEIAKLALRSGETRATGGVTTLTLRP